ncbi:uncharacterized protein LOC144123906 [Amblyomma americanum]
MLNLQHGPCVCSHLQHLFRVQHILRGTLCVLKDFEYNMKLKPGAGVSSCQLEEFWWPVKTSWLDDKRDVPEAVRPYWSYREEIHTQDGLLFRSNKRLMGRQTITLLPVPAQHMVPEMVPSRTVHSRLQETRQCQRSYCNRGSRHLPPLSQGQQVTAYDTLHRTWAPAIFLRPAETPRSAILKTEDGREIRRTRKHIRDVTPRPDDLPASGDPDVALDPSELRRSTRQRLQPCRYPLPERR